MGHGKHKRNNGEDLFLHLTAREGNQKGHAAPAAKHTPPQSPTLRSLPTQEHPTPLEAHIGTPFPPTVITQATERTRCKLLGSGGFGKVYAGTLPGVASKVAIKVATSGGRPSLVREAVALRVALHPCIMRVLGTCWEEGVDALVLELVPCGDLDYYLAMPCPEDHAESSSPKLQTPAPATAAKAGEAVTGAATTTTAAAAAPAPPPAKGQRKRLGWQRRVLLTYQMASALAFMHQGCGCGLQVLHRDVKPGNILLDEEGNAKLADFGIARLVELQEDTTAEGSVSKGQGGSATYLNQTNPPQSSSASLQHRHHLHPHHPPSPQQQQHQGHHHHNHHHHHGDHHGQASSPSSPLAAKLAQLETRLNISSSSGSCRNRSPAPGSNSSRASTPMSPASGILQDHGWAGTYDYLDPLYEQLGQLSDKSDVYSLGLIMAQLLQDSSEPLGAKHVLQHAVHVHQLHLPKGLEDWPVGNALAYAGLAVRCCALKREARPSSGQVVEQLLPLVREALGCGAQGQEQQGQQQQGQGGQHQKQWQEQQQQQQQGGKAPQCKLVGGLWEGRWAWSLASAETPDMAAVHGELNSGARSAVAGGIKVIARGGGVDACAAAAKLPSVDLPAAVGPGVAAPPAPTKLSDTGACPNGTLGGTAGGWGNKAWGKGQAAGAAATGAAPAATAAGCSAMEAVAPWPSLASNSSNSSSKQAGVQGLAGNAWGRPASAPKLGTSPLMGSVSCAGATPGAQGAPAVSKVDGGSGAAARSCSMSSSYKQMPMVFLELDLGADGTVGGAVTLVLMKKRYMQPANCGTAVGSMLGGKAGGAAGAAASGDSSSCMGTDVKAEGKGVVVGPRMVGIKSGRWTSSGEVSLWCEGAADLLPFLPADLQPKQQQQYRGVGAAGRKGGPLAAADIKDLAGHGAVAGVYPWEFEFVGKAVDGLLEGEWELKEFRGAEAAGKGVQVCYQWLKGPLHVDMGSGDALVVGQQQGVGFRGSRIEGQEAQQAAVCLEHAGSAVLAALTEEQLIV